MGDSDYLRLGDWNASCSMCGCKRKASEMVKNWQGMWRCPEHNEARQPQDFVRGVPDIQTPPWVQQASTAFVGVCSPNASTAFPSFATPGCFMPNYLSPMFDPTVTNF
jgi:hypothetical protein